MHLECCGFVLHGTTCICLCVPKNGWQPAERPSVVCTAIAGSVHVVRFHLLDLSCLWHHPASPSNCRHNICMRVSEMVNQTTVWHFNQALVSRALANRMAKKSCVQCVLCIEWRCIQLSKHSYWECDAKRERCVYVLFSVPLCVECCPGLIGFVLEFRLTVVRRHREPSALYLLRDLCAIFNGQFHRGDRFLS